MTIQLRGPSHLVNILRDHLFPGDGKEAVAIALCGHHEHKGNIYLFIQEVLPISNDDCTLRSANEVEWRTESILPMLTKAMNNNMSIIKIHSHPNNSCEFSYLDDISDCKFFESVDGWLDNRGYIASAIMLESGLLIARLLSENSEFTPFDRFSIIGNDITIYDKNTNDKAQPFTQRHAQMFGSLTTDQLARMRIGIVGTSGTGSIVIELLHRLGVGELILIDPDHIEEKNLNRIVNSRKKDTGQYKTDCLKSAIDSIGLQTKVTSVTENLNSRNAVLELASCDCVFGCVDSAEGRSLINRVATFYLLPYIDVGIRLNADGHGGIDQICGSVHYLRPGGSSLLSRNAITSEKIRAECLRRTNSSQYEQEMKEGYIKGVDVERPAVISINMFFASQAVNEFLARLHPYRDDPNEMYAQYSMSLTQMLLYPPRDDGPVDINLLKHVGRGDVEPLLDMPSLSLGVKNVEIN